MNEEIRETELEAVESTVPGIGDVNIVVNGNIKSLSITVNHFNETEEDNAE
ncbi:MAG: hypothetical protein V3G42_10580 [Oscillospiraceae bacterium]